MKTIDEYLEEQINEQLCQAILSGSRGDGPSKVKIRPVEIRGKVVYQASETVGTKVLHKNYSREELISYLKAGLQHDFSQLQASGMALDGTILVSKKGKMTIKTRRHPENGKGLAFGKDKTFSKGTQILAHNRVKQYILKENIPVPFLVDLGVMNKEGRIITQKYDKFRQINRFLEFIQDILPRLDQQREVTILDFGCGSGRDTKYFLDNGYKVDAVDGSKEMCRRASEYTGISVKNMMFTELNVKEKYDGIWACSSILHLTKDELENVMNKMTTALKPNGIIYASFKYGNFSGERNGRYFTDMTEETFEELIKKVDGITLEEQWITSDVRVGRGEEKWLNVLLRRG